MWTLTYVEVHDKSVCGARGAVCQLIGQTCVGFRSDFLRTRFICVVSLVLLEGCSA